MKAIQASKNAVPMLIGAQCSEMLLSMWTPSTEPRVYRPQVESSRLWKQPSLHRSLVSTSGLEISQWLAITYRMDSQLLVLRTSKTTFPPSLCWALTGLPCAGPFPPPRCFSPCTQGTSGETRKILNPGQQPQRFWVNWAGVVLKHDYWLKCPQVNLRCFLGWEIRALWSKLVFIKMPPLHAADHRHLSGLWALTCRQMGRVV